MNYFDFIHDIGSGVMVTIFLLVCIFGPVIYWIYTEIKSWF